MDRVLFSSHTDMWETPQDLFDELNKEFRFTLDVCATAQNAKCERFYSPVCNGLLQPWWGGRQRGATHPMVGKSEIGCAKHRSPPQRAAP